MSSTFDLSFQAALQRLKQFWHEQGAALIEPYDMPMGAGTFHPETFFRVLGPKPYAAAFVQPSRRPTDGRYGQSLNRLQKFHQFQVVLKPSPKDVRSLYLASLHAAFGINSSQHDLRFVEDNWKSPTLGASGLGWEVWLDGMEISQFTYFQVVAGQECRPVSVELTYGLERLMMYLQEKSSVYDVQWNEQLLYRDLFWEGEKQHSAYNFEHAEPDALQASYQAAHSACYELLKHAEPLYLPAYERALEASHLLNMLDARRAISISERQGMILQVRDMTKACALAYLETPLS